MFRGKCPVPHEGRNLSLTPEVLGGGVKKIPSDEKMGGLKKRVLGNLDFHVKNETLP